LVFVGPPHHGVDVVHHPGHWVCRIARLPRVQKEQSTDVSLDESQARQKHPHPPEMVWPLEGKMGKLEYLQEGARVNADLVDPALGHRLQHLLAV
jgi:hypothetical protein